MLRGIFNIYTIEYTGFDVKNLILCSLIVVLQAQYIYSQDETWDLHQLSGAGETVKNGLVAVAAGQVVNWTFSSFNFFIYGADWGLPTRASIQRNFTTPWKWEHLDNFVVNR